MPQNNPLAYLSGRFREQAGRDLPRGREAEDEYLQRVRGANPGAAAERQAESQFARFGERINKMLRNFRGQQVGAGRLDTGFRFEDEDELYRQGLDDLGRTLADNAMRAQELDLRAAEGLGSYGERATGRGLDILASERDTELLEQDRRDRERAQKRSGLFGLLGRVGGTLLGPAGSVVGERLGDKIGRLFQ